MPQLAKQQPKDPNYAEEQRPYRHPGPRWPRGRPGRRGASRLRLRAAPRRRRVPRCRRDAPETGCLLTSTRLPDHGREPSAEAFAPSRRRRCGHKRKPPTPDRGLRDRTNTPPRRAHPRRAEHSRPLPAPAPSPIWAQSPHAYASSLASAAARDDARLRGGRRRATAPRPPFRPAQAAASTSTAPAPVPPGSGYRRGDRWRTALSCPICRNSRSRLSSTRICVKSPHPQVAPCAAGALYRSQSLTSKGLIGASDKNWRTQPGSLLLWSLRPKRSSAKTTTP